MEVAPPFYVGAGGCAEALQLLLFTRVRRWEQGVVQMLSIFFSLPSHCHFVARSGFVRVHSFSSEKERTKKADQRALPFGFP
jgi:hypothetical protein